MMQIYFFKYKDLNIIESEINSVLGKVNIWLFANKLSVNIAKSTFVIFYPVQKQIPKKVMLFINHQSSTVETSIRYFGVYIDSNIDSIVRRTTLAILLKKIIIRRGILSKLRYFLNTKTLLSLYYTLVEPFLNYCIIAWSNAYQSTLFVHQTSAKGLCETIVFTCSFMARMQARDQYQVIFDVAPWQPMRKSYLGGC